MHLHYRSIRQAVLAELKRQHMSRYRLAQLLGIHRQSLYRMLDNGEHGFTTRYADRMLEILGLRITPPECKPQPARGRGRRCC